MRGSISKPIPVDVAVAALCAHWKVEVVDNIDDLTAAFIGDLNVVDHPGLAEKVRFAISGNLNPYLTGQGSLTFAASSILSSIKALTT
jgi:hypothetical protein